MPIAQFFRKVETSQMSALCFKLFRLSYSVLTFKSLKARIHLLSWNHLLVICVIGTPWVQTKTTTESRLERPGTSPWYALHCSDARAAIQKCVAFVCLWCHTKYMLLIKTEELSWTFLGLLSASWSFFLPLQEARSVGASVVSPVDIQKVNISTFFCLVFLSDFFSSLFPFYCSWLITRDPLAFNNCGELGCTPFMRMFKLF